MSFFSSVLKTNNKIRFTTYLTFKYLKPTIYKHIKFIIERKTNIMRK